MTCRLSSDQWLLENSAGRDSQFVSVFFLVSASRHRWRAPTVIRASTERRFELGWRQIAKARVRPHLVVVLSPLLDPHLRVHAVPKPLEAQKLVAELSVEGFVGHILPRLPRPVRAGIEHEVVRPHVVLRGRRQRPGPSRGPGGAGGAAGGPATRPGARVDASDRGSSRVPPVSRRCESGDTRSGDTGPPSGASRPRRRRPAPPAATGSPTSIARPRARRTRAPTIFFA